MRALSIAERILLLADQQLRKYKYMNQMTEHDELHILGAIASPAGHYDLFLEGPGKWLRKPTHWELTVDAVWLHVSPRGQVLRRDWLRVQLLLDCSADEHVGMLNAYGIQEVSE